MFDINDDKLEQYPNASSLIVVTELGIVTDVKAEQFVNTESLIVVNDKLVGSVTDVKLVHESNATEPILVTLSGIFILVNEELFLKASEPIDVTLIGIVIVTFVILTNELYEIIFVLSVDKFKKASVMAISTIFGTMPAVVKLFLVYPWLYMIKTD